MGTVQLSVYAYVCTMKITAYWTSKTVSQYSYVYYEQTHLLVMSVDQWLRSHLDTTQLQTYTRLSRDSTSLFNKIITYFYLRNPAITIQSQSHYVYYEQTHLLVMSVDQWLRSRLDTTQLQTYTRLSRDSTSLFNKIITYLNIRNPAITITITIGTCIAHAVAEFAEC